MSRNKDVIQKYKSSTHYIISGLIPYTEANLKLSFKPSQFFRDLEKLDGVKASKKSIKNNYYRLIREDLIRISDEGLPILTKKAFQKVKQKKPKRLDKNKKLLITFDIPEKERNKRDALRLLLRELSFKKVQLSVWETEYDYEEYLKSEIPKHGLSRYVSIYISTKIKL